MSQEVTGRTRTFTAGAAIPQYSRVKLSSGKLAVADGADGAITIGTTTRETFADGDEVAVLLRNAQGTHQFIASEAIAVGDACYTVDDGEVEKSAAATTLVGIALTASSADQGLVLRFTAPPGAALFVCSGPPPA